MRRCRPMTVEGFFEGEGGIEVRLPSLARKETRTGRKCGRGRPRTVGVPGRGLLAVAGVAKAS